MAVEIKEIVVKAIIVGEQGSKEETEPESPESAASFQAPDPGAMPETIIQTCVDQVLKILRKRNLR